MTTTGYDDGVDPDADERVRVSVELTSTRLTAREITEVLGMEPDKSWSIGDRRKSVEDESHPRAFYEFSRWSVFSTLDPTRLDHDHLDNLWLRCAEALERVPQLGSAAEMYVSFYRNLDGRAYQGHGFHVPSRWTELLGRIGGAIDVDQYVLRDGPGIDD